MYSASNNAGSLAGSQFANVTGNPVLPSGTCGGISRWFNTAAFFNPVPFTCGNTRRNLLRGPNYGDYDAAIMKSFHLPINEQSALKFRLESDNVLNHPNLNNPNGTAGSGAFGTITSASNPRSLQAGVQFLF